MEGVRISSICVKQKQAYFQILVMVAVCQWCLLLPWCLPKLKPPKT